MNDFDSEFGWLEASDKNIIEADLCFAEYNGNEEGAISLLVGDELSSAVTYEIILTKTQLKKLLKIMKENEM